MVPHQPPGERQGSQKSKLGRAAPPPLLPTHTHSLPSAQIVTRS